MRFLRPAVVLLAVGLIATPAVLASMPMNLSELAQGADKIFRGNVVSVREDVEVVGHAKILTTTYLMLVEESFKGTFETLKGIQVAELSTTQVFGTLPEGTALPANLDTPQLQKGESYLLFTAAPSAQGLTTTLGQGQGVFQIDRADSLEHTYNELKNRDLFVGVVGVRSAGGPISYKVLAGHVRAELFEQE